MHASIAIAASGLRPADVRARATAHDTANLATPVTTLPRAVVRTTDDMLGSLIDTLG